MSAEDNRRIVTQFITIVQDRKYEDLLTISAQDATWWISGPQEKLPFFGTHLLADRVPHMKEAFGRANSITYDIRGITANEHEAVVEYSVKAEGPAEGQHYENENLTKFTLKDGKILQVREYIDTNPIFEYMGAA
ncbi:hypothetical protein CVT25_013805 [Psilocybe cyanescens]|uniref:SnoaL-like domain-containing protein n=1 Tax=Psilocybe cyanescens TaxID=93625 RepID=A0A409XUJ5_PSICY|nr:hypothetical protein CVT25_013805 [Psilocybe cyanescens]